MTWCEQTLEEEEEEEGEEGKQQQEANEASPPRIVFFLAGWREFDCLSLGPNKYSTWHCVANNITCISFIVSF